MPPAPSSPRRAQSPYVEENRFPNDDMLPAFFHAIEAQHSNVRDDVLDPNDSIDSSPPRREEGIEQGNESSESDEETSDDDFTTSESENDEAIMYENPNRIDAEKIKSWAINNKINQSAVQKLLLILRERLLPDLPKDARTFLNTSSAKYTIEPMEGKSVTPGEFVYYGIRKRLES